MAVSSGLDGVQADATAEILPRADRVAVDTASSLPSRVKIGALWVVVGRSVGAMTSLAINVLLARFLPHDAFGTWILINTIVAFSSAVAVFGLSGTVLRLVAENLALGSPSRARRALLLCSTAVISSVIGTCLLVYLLVARFGDTVFRYTELSALALWVAAGLVAFSVLQFLADALRGLHENRVANLLAGPSGGALAGCLFLLVTVPIAVSSGISLELCLQLNVAAMAIVIPLGVITLIHSARNQFTGDNQQSDGARGELRIPAMLSQCLPLMLAQLLSIAIAQGDIWIAGMFYSNEELALFSSARRLTIAVAIPGQMVVLTVMSSIPDLYARGRLRDLEVMLRTTATIAAIPSCITILLLVLFPQTILGTIYGPFFEQGATSLVFLCLGQAVLSLTGSTYYALTLTGHQNYALGLNFLAVVTLVIAGSWAAANYGLETFSAISAACLAFSSIGGWWLTRKLVGVSPHVSLRLGRLPRPANSGLKGLFTKSQAKQVKMPNLYLLGAPKTGTTSLHAYLATHPNIFMSTPKEPHFWDDDFVGANLSSHTNISTIDEYLDLFKDANDNHLYRGEATVTYLYSERAVRRIYEHCPDAMFIVMLRDPVELAYSWHSMEYYSCYEDEADFSRAWDLQQSRSEGAVLPRGCFVPEFLQYRRVAALGEQVERLLATVPASNVKFILHEEFGRNTRQIYLDVLKFLGLPDDGRTHFPRLNQSKRFRFRWFAQLWFAPPRPIAPLIQLVRRSYGWLSPPVRGSVEFFRVSKSKDNIPTETANRLRDYFRSDIERLETLLNWDLSHWKTGAKVRAPLNGV